MNTRLLVVDDHAGFLAAASAVCAATPGVELRGTATNASDAIAMACRIYPDLILVDLRLADEDGVHLADQLGELIPEALVVVCSTLDRHDLPSAATTRHHLLKENLSVATLAELAADAA